MGDNNMTDSNDTLKAQDDAPQESSDQATENHNQDVSETNDETSSGRGHKRSLEQAENDIDDDEKNDSNYDLPSNVHVTWDGQDATVAIDFKDKEQESCICIVGRARLRCLQGSLHIHGYSMENLEGDTQKEVMLTSPYWSSWTTIQTTCPETKFTLTSVRGTPSFRLASPSRRPTVIPNSWISTADQILSDCNNSPVAQRDSLENDDVYLHDKPQIIMVCGGKGVGKSTFLRYMTNRLLSSSGKSSNSRQEVAILDADVGQPELVPPGIVSLSIQKGPLLQPPYWNLTQPVESIGSIFYGAVSSKIDPTRYVEAIQQLVQKYRDYLQTTSNPTPLLINMDGWIKGLGYEILTALILQITPTYVCQILGTSKGKTFDLQNVLSGKESTIFFLDACTNLIAKSCSIPSFTLRSLRLGAYFGPQMLELWDRLDFTPAKQLQVGWVDEDCMLAEYLASERPYCVPFEAVTCSFAALDQKDLTTETLILQAMNGGIVGLCIEDANNCVGLGLLRSIDWQRRLMYILTPVEASTLSKVNALVGGSLPLPLSFVFRGVHAESFPYQSMTQFPSTSAALGTDPMKSRNNIGRKGNTANGGN
jgi:polynucleotide 5'-hydroxyl-kinase GRC3/NOL9